MLAGIYYGAQYGGSTTAILVNLPGEASSIVTCLDGHAMARQGRAGPALAIAAIGSFVAGCFATLVVAVVSAPLVSLARAFGPAEYFALMTLGLVLSVVLARGSPLKAIGMILFGVLLSTLRRVFGARRTRAAFRASRMSRISTAGSPSRSA
jgi:putative tricarboxylic transport membrane protein